MKMQIIAIDLQNISAGTKEWLLNTLNFVGVPYVVQEVEPQTLEEFNKDLEEGEAEFERGEFISHEELIKKAQKW